MVCLSPDSALPQIYSWLPCSEGYHSLKFQSIFKAKKSRKHRTDSLGGWALFISWKTTLKADS